MPHQIVADVTAAVLYRKQQLPLPMQQQFVPSTDATVVTSNLPMAQQVGSSMDGAASSAADVTAVCVLYRCYNYCFYRCPSS